MANTSQTDLDLRFKNEKFVNTKTKFLLAIVVFPTEPERHVWKKKNFQDVKKRRLFGVRSILE